MDFPNAFIGRKTKPSTYDLAAKLGPSLAAWNELITWLTNQGLDCGIWHSVGPKYGWALRPRLKARNILYMGPCDGRFRVSLVLGDRAIAATSSSKLPPDILKEIAGARRYAEGTGVRILVKSPEDLPAIKKLVEIKLAN